MIEDLIKREPDILHRNQKVFILRSGGLTEEQKLLIYEMKYKVSKHLGALRELDTETILKTLLQASFDFAESQSH